MSALRADKLCRRKRQHRKRRRTWTNKIFSFLVIKVFHDLDIACLFPWDHEVVTLSDTKRTVQWLLHVILKGIRLIVCLNSHWKIRCFLYVRSKFGLNAFSTGFFMFSAARWAVHCTSQQTWRWQNSEFNETKMIMKQQQKKKMESHNYTIKVKKNCDCNKCYYYLVWK